jgi:large subunit ribosomal protein L20
MPRVTGGSRAHKRHKKVLKQAKGYWGSRSKLYRRAKEAVLRANEHRFAGRKIKKRDFRKLWITRISGALYHNENLNYSTFIKALKDNNIEINRKMLSQLAINHKEGFDAIVNKVTK